MTWLPTLAQTGTYEGPSLAWATARVLLALLVVLPLVYLVAKALSRHASRWAKGRAVRVIDTAVLGPNRWVHLIEVAGRILVVGATPERVSLLSEISEPERIAEVLIATSGEGTVNFSDFLKGALRRWQETDDSDRERQ